MRDFIDPELPILEEGKGAVTPPETMTIEVDQKTVLTVKWINQTGNQLGKITISFGG